MMNRDDYLRFHKDFCDKARDLSARKNNDYAGQGGEKPFANFERVAAMGICSTEQGFLVRMTDKLSRLATFAAGGKLQVADESALDTLLDVVNYGVLLAAFISQKDVGDRGMLPEDMDARVVVLPSGVRPTDLTPTSQGAYVVAVGGHRRACVADMLLDRGWRRVPDTDFTFMPPRSGAGA